MTTAPLLVIGRLALDPDMRTRIAAASAGQVPTEDLIYSVIRADGVAENATLEDISETHPHGVDSSGIQDAAILAAVAAYQPPEETP